MQFSKKIFSLIILLASFAAKAQEFVAPLQENVELHNRPTAATANKPTLLSLPFFEDFTDDNPFPSQERWADFNVYVNNTMGVNPISRGVATFDALNKLGIPYDTVTAYTQVKADTLTSLAIDMSGNSPVDSVYLSFFYQPKGYGFSPKPADSLMLYLLKSNGSWEKVWSAPGDSLRAFRQVMIAITDPLYFSDNFQFRFINKATKGISDSHWNLDYIRLDEGRTINNTSVNDIAFTRQPTSILNDFSAMPLRHFKTNPASFLATTQNVTIRNNGTATQNVNTGYTAKVINPATALGSGTGTASLPSGTNQAATFPIYNAGGFNPGNPNGRYVFENKYYCNSTYPNESKINDTIIHQQIFDNYFAYDDGTAEQSYFLNLLPSAPGVTAVEYALYAPDTLRGIAIRFARQVPSAWQKEFSIAVYKDIAVNGGTDIQVYSENFLFPQYEDTVNKFSVYRFEKPLVMEAGVFFIGIVQPAGGTSDSLYIALDANRESNNHRYFKVDAQWQPSLYDGALLLRPLVGSDLPLAVHDITIPSITWSLTPNPASDLVQLKTSESLGTHLGYHIYNIQGKVLLEGFTKNNDNIDVRSLQPGIYFVRIHTDKGMSKPVKLLKL